MPTCTGMVGRRQLQFPRRILISELFLCISQSPIPVHLGFIPIKLLSEPLNTLKASRRAERRMSRRTASPHCLILLGLLLTLHLASSVAQHTLYVDSASLKHDTFSLLGRGPTEWVPSTGKVRPVRRLTCGRALIVLRNLHSPHPSALHVASSRRLRVRMCHQR